MVTAVQNSSTSTSTVGATSSKNKLDPQQFIKIMLKELEQQDPLNPTSSKDLVNQMSQIQSIQSNMDLSTTLKDLALSQKLASAGNLLGKVVTGKNSNGDDVSGIATSVKREGDKVYLELDSGNQLAVEDVLGVNNPTAATNATSTQTPTLPATPTTTTTKS
jgi:flagellar basal-body rod modification protein FlgD